jgi:hypothetical protein
MENGEKQGLVIKTYSQNKIKIFCKDVASIRENLLVCILCKS